jgi:hypothetical protein
MPACKRRARMPILPSPSEAIGLIQLRLILEP